MWLPFVYHLRGSVIRCIVRNDELIVESLEGRDTPKKLIEEVLPVVRRDADAYE